MESKNLKFSERPLVFTDLETMGLEKYRSDFPGDDKLYPWHEVCEVGVVLVAQQSLLPVLEWSTKIKVEYPCRASEKALEINGYNPQNWRDAMDLRDALLHYREITRGGVFVAHNVTFDWGFWEIASARWHVPFEMDYHRIDLFSYAKAALDAKGYQLESYRLRDLSKFLGLEDEPMPHRAVNGAMQAYKVFKALRELKPAMGYSALNPERLRSQPASHCQQDYPPDRAKFPDQSSMPADPHL